jgi:hypothetical protein
MIVRIISDTLAYDHETGKRIVNLRNKRPEIASQKMNLLIEVFNSWNWTVIDQRRDLIDPEPELPGSEWR